MQNYFLTETTSQQLLHDNHAKKSKVAKPGEKEKLQSEMQKVNRELTDVRGRVNHIQKEIKHLEKEILASGKVS